MESARGRSATWRRAAELRLRPRYKILGACNPPFAYEALQVDLEVGLMMPCNVIVHEDDDKRATVLAIDPTKTVAATGNQKLVELAASVKDKLTRALAKLE
jgi:uncharacterized protein (DUF302 family)